MTTTQNTAHYAESGRIGRELRYGGRLIATAVRVERRGLYASVRYDNGKWCDVPLRMLDADLTAMLNEAGS